MSKNIFTELSNAMADAVEQAGKFTVLVEARRRFPASGIAFAKDMILTADHVVERDEDIKVLLGDGTEINARLIGRDPGTDLAVLKLDPSALPSAARHSATPAEVAKTPARVGQFVLAIGRPSKNGIESSFGTINAIGGPVRTGRGGMLESYIKTDVISYPGFSGGPLINGEGQVFGINTSGFRSGGAITIPAEVAWIIAETLTKYGRIKRGYLGIRSQTVNIPVEGQQQLNRKQETGLLIVGLELDSPAGKGGLMVGDILAGVADEAIEHHDELFTRLSGEVVGKFASLDVLRGGKLQVMDVVVGER
ncbi:MAG: trypsin-like peptidase domain-containing protein [Anaerolineales bacterium]|nr:trypsin-like peptidase domain-containing protein [Anaerolineales bacterium]MDP2776631.1 trypsin-like peptidase domain-containing protein [Anaerolineales bacterium]